MWKNVWLLILRCTEGMCFEKSPRISPQMPISFSSSYISHKHVIFLNRSILKYLEPFLSVSLSLFFGGYYEDFFYVLMWKIRAVWGLRHMLLSSITINHHSNMIVIIM